MTPSVRPSSVMLTWLPYLLDFFPSHSFAVQWRLRMIEIYRLHIPAVGSGISSPQRGPCIMNAQIRTKILNTNEESLDKHHSYLIPFFMYSTLVRFNSTATCAEWRKHHPALIQRWDFGSTFGWWGWGSNLNPSSYPQFLPIAFR